MDKHEAGRVLGLADADVLSVEQTEDGARVTVRDGGDRLITDDGVFALSDHPATAQLRRHEGDPASAEDSEPYDPTQDDDPGDPGTDVPDGSADVVLTWVGDDAERAQRALAAEDKRDHPRSTLVAKLRALVG